MTLGVSDAHAEQFSLRVITALAGMLTDNLADSFFPDDGPFARHHYPKHIEAIEATAHNDVFSVFGGNRTGKTTLLAYIVSCWLTGKYPPWWKGRVFQKPTTGWIVSQTSVTIVRALQIYLIGASGEGGLIPRSNLLNVQYSPNALGMAHRIQVRHEPTGLTSDLYVKTYDMGWKRFQSDTIDFAVLDEEPPAKVYSESATRSATTNGITLLGFTALDGVTPLVAHLLPEFAGAEEMDGEAEPLRRGHVFIGWDDVPYSQISKEKRKNLAASYLPHERDARMKGIPSIGTGLIYPVGHEQFVVDADTAMKAWRGPTPPKHWPRIAAADPGGTPKGDGRTAALWAAYDEDSDCLWIYAEYYARFSPITSHVHAWAKKGNWIPFCIDPAGANITDGKAVYAEYVSEMRELNKDWPVHKADKRWSLGRAELYDRMTSERCKVLSTCTNFLAEHRGYARNENNQIIGVCHLLDCARYLVRGARHAALPPQYQRHDVIPEQRFF